MQVSLRCELPKIGLLFAVIPGRKVAARRAIRRKTQAKISARAEESQKDRLFIQQQEDSDQNTNR